MPTASEPRTETPRALFRDKCALIAMSGSVRVTFSRPQRAITPGQAVVLYDGDIVLGGGEIQCALPEPEETERSTP